MNYLICVTAIFTLNVKQNEKTIKHFNIVCRVYHSEDLMVDKTPRARLQSFSLDRFYRILHTAERFYMIKIKCMRKFFLGAHVCTLFFLSPQFVRAVYTVNLSTRS